MSRESVPTSSLTPLLKKTLRAVVVHEEVTAREVSLDVGVREGKARHALARLEHLGLVASRYNGYAIIHYATVSGRVTVELMAKERIATAEQEAILAAADPASIIVCPACLGGKTYCAVCLGCRMVTTEQAAAHSGSSLGR